jgi:hypothetical protein
MASMLGLCRRLWIVSWWRFRAAARMAAARHRKIGALEYGL